MCSKLGQRCIPGQEVSQHLFIATQRTVGQKLRTKLAHLPKRKTCWRGTFMQDILPDHNSSWQTCLPERSPNTVAVGNMQHRSSLSLKHEPPGRVKECYEHRNMLCDGIAEQIAKRRYP